MSPALATNKLTTNQIRGFWAAWAGWALDGMDSFIYALVLVPALRDLLPRSGIPANDANIGFYGGALFAVFLVGWGLAFLWGPIADRFGRVRILVLTILCYSVFTFLGCIATSVWQLALFRLLSGIGIGGEWTIGGVFVAEEWPESRRRQGAAYMHTGYYFGTLLAEQFGRRGALAWYFVLTFLCVALGFGYVFYLGAGALRGFMILMFFLGVGGASFGVFTLWLPEQYRSECRGSAFAFATSSGRFITAGVTFLVGAAVSSMHTIGTPVAVTSLAFLVGLALLPAAEETRGKELPA